MKSSTPPSSLKAFSLLLNGNMMRQRVSHSGAVKYCIYDANTNPIMVISESAQRHLTDMLRKSNGFLVLNKTYVRGMHKNSLFYKRYKQDYETRKGTSRSGDTAK